ncbi:TPA: MFS transporter [Enterococcus faecium]|nr:MFS transporter [Enterococcus faecium]HAQ6720804.1 MFS transporter [Enterococcus faecium]HAQ6804735.1 MFS transporter [Enterococcus faecium]HAQ7406351.1 MFS transporter [Enterococcus faecium]HAR1711172.1 MFS transporter [Enterococcus faecium]
MDTIGKSLGLKEKMAYGCGDAASNIIWASMGAFMMFYYTDVVNISAATIGTIFLISRVINAVVALATGWLIDNTKSKYGKARPWLLWFAVPFAIVTFAIFSVPDIAKLYQVIYVFITYNAMMTVYSLINIPYGSMATMMTKDQYQRTLLNIFRQLFAQIASLLVTAFTLPLVKVFSSSVGEKNAWSVVYGIFGIAAGVLFFLCFIGTKERIHDNEVVKEEKINIVKGMKSVLKNNYWVMLMVISISINIFFQAISTVNTYYCKAVLHDSNMIGILNTAYIVPAIVAFFFVHLIVKKFGKGYTTMFGWIIICASYAVLLPFTENHMALIITSAMRGVGYCFLLAVSSAMVSDAVEYGEWKTHVRVEGLTFSMQGFVTTIAAGLVTAFIGGVLDFSKYDGTLTFAQAQPVTAVTAVKLLFIAMPFIVGALNVLLLKFYKLDKMYPKIIEDLNMRNSVTTK